jgi:predicted SprT family Zn-dependent metalloprotease
MQTEVIRNTSTGSSEECSFLEFKPESNLQTEPINEQLREHQSSSDDWDRHSLLKELHLWTKRFILEFKLKTGVPAIMVDHLHRNCYGSYRHGRNGFGLRNEIAINQSYLDERKFWEVLGTLLHELLHAEQEQSGKPGKYNYHNKAFRERAKYFGLIVNQTGLTEYTPPPSPFWSILAQYGIELPDTPLTLIVAPPPTDKPGKSKLKLWICKCTPKPVRVRVAIKDFQARCLKCGEQFEQAD